ncbi:hypothetical protein AB0395_00675 [Streptosporangium sp. NPDC051023]|uniref:hypothetical protein n=1 Tax=Streptosporangium sp. NPDC051023 TaxID=3155410 RepID=UPI00344D0D16
MDEAGSTTARPAIPGWRIIRSDTGRLWASRESPFADAVTRGQALNVPPFRTVDADTFDELCEEVERQEAAAGLVIP